MKKKILFVFGTRPEAIKLAPLIKWFKTMNKFEIKICSTGQHREMLDPILNVFGIQPDIDLGLMTYNQTLPYFVSISIKEISNYLENCKPDYLVIQGDTSTVVASAMAAFYYKIKVLHVEAGLRTSDFYSPFPEEMNRRLTTQLSYFHFAPTIQSKLNLLKEGVNEKRIFVTGNTSIDALLEVKKGLENGEIELGISPYILEEISKYKRMILITGHRRENFGDGLLRVCKTIINLSIEFPDILFLYPVHLNPNVKEVVYRLLGSIPNVVLIAPQGYVEFIYLMSRSYIILTDSGGVQEEGPSLGKPILVMRENTERPEGVESGCSILVGTSEEKISFHVRKLLTDEIYYNKMAIAKNPYGDGFASKNIVDALMKNINEEINNTNLNEE